MRVSGLRNPCAQIDSFRRGLLKVAVGRDLVDDAVRKSEIRGVVTAGGVVHLGEEIKVEWPAQPRRRLTAV